MGIDALGRLIRISPDVAEQHQVAVIDCLETMNKVFQHAGDLVNPKVAHNLIRLIAEGFGEDDDTADSQLRSAAVESYLKIVDEPKLPSAFLQVMCWVLGEYGTADGKYSASYISGKLCDVAEAHSSDDVVKAYAVTALMKVYSFEKAAGRKFSLLPECQSLLEELFASHSSDLQQRAYEFQAILGLDANAIENIMPLDASCEDIEIDKSLSFLDSYVHKALEEGAEPYIPENERSGTLTISSFGNQNPYESAAHSLRFEAYEVPKPVVPTRIPQTVSYPTELVPIQQPSYHPEVQSAPSLRPVSDASSAELRLRLDGVQKKWGKPTYSSAASSSASNFDSQTVNGATQADTVVSKPREPSYDSRRQPHVEVSEEKQKLAASLFGGSTSRSEKKQSATTQKARPANTTATATTTTVVQAPPPDLLDLGEPTGATSSYSSAVDPFKELEGLLDVGHDGNAAATSTGSDLMSLYSDASTNGQTQNATSTNGSVTPSRTASLTKGPSRKDALDKDALVRQMGVNPTSQNPNLFSDLLG